jgi:hypothetical protein
MNATVGKAITDAIVNLLDAVKEVVKEQGYNYFQVDDGKSKAGATSPDTGVGTKPSSTEPQPKSGSAAIQPPGQIKKPNP